MQATKLHITLTQSQLRQNAMVRDGISPKGMSIKRQTQVQKDRKAAAKGGYSKHKARFYD